MSKHCLAVRHVAFEDLGAFADPISKAGYETQLIDAPVADLSVIDPLDPDLLVLLGGPIGVYETDAYPFLATEIAWAKARLEADSPILGLCLGAQVMTVADAPARWPRSAKRPSCTGTGMLWNYPPGPSIWREPRPARFRPGPGVHSHSRCNSMLRQTRT